MSKPVYIYRYRQLFTYNLDCLITNEIYASSPTNLNDPLDCSLSYDANKLFEMLIKRKKFLQEAISIFLTKKIDSFDSYEEYSKYYSECYNNVLNANNKSTIIEYIERRAKKIITDIRDFFGIVSFSANINNPVLWTHYASNRSGYALMYIYDEVERLLQPFLNNFKKEHGEELGTLFGIQKVEYTDSHNDCTSFLYWQFMHNNKESYHYNFDFDKRLINSFKNNFELLKSLLLSKRMAWSYEQEYRIIVPFRKDSFSDFVFDLPFSNERLDKKKTFSIGDMMPCAILFGEKIPLYARTLIGFIAQKNNIQLFELDAPFLDGTGKITYKKVTS